MLVAQAGVRSLVEWLRTRRAGTATQEVSDEVFDAAPRALARSINLQQTVQLIKTTIEVAEESTAKKILRLVDALEENDDVQDVFSNFDIPERVLETVAG